MLRLLSLTGCVVALASAPAFAQTAFIADLRGANENPPVSSPGSGSALVLFDPAFQTMTVREVYSGVTTPTTDGHIHCCSVPSANAAVAVGFRPAGFQTGVTEQQFNGSFDLNNLASYNAPFVTANGGTVASARTALINGVQGGLAYVNVHTTRFPGGEIRGQLFTSPDLTPAAYSLLPEVVLQTAEFQDSTVRRYLRDVRGAGGGMAGQTATLGADHKIGMFLVASGRFGEFESRTNRPRVDLGSRGLIGGVDYRMGPSTLIGAMFGYDDADARLTSTSQQSHVRNWFGGAYGSLAAGPAYIDLHASYGKSNFDLARHIAVSTFAADSVGDTESEQWLVAGTAGLNVQMTGAVVEPYAGARYVHLDLDGFTETGNMAALTVGGAKIESLQSIAGLRVGADIPVGGASIRPSITGEWRHEFNNDGARLIAGSFGGAGAFTYTTTPLGDDYYVVGAGFTIAGAGPLSFGADYSGQRGGGYDVHTISGALRLIF